jgi:hypothetical protein
MPQAPQIAPISQNRHLFADGSYEPVTVDGAQADRLCCFVRQHEDDRPCRGEPVSWSLRACRRAGRPHRADTGLLAGSTVAGTADRPRRVRRGRRGGGTAAVRRSASGGSGRGVTGGDRRVTGPPATRTSPIVPQYCRNGRWQNRLPWARS